MNGHVARQPDPEAELLVTRPLPSPQPTPPHLHHQGRWVEGRKTPDTRNNSVNCGSRAWKGREGLQSTPAGLVSKKKIGVFFLQRYWGVKWSEHTGHSSKEGEASSRSLGITFSANWSKGQLPRSLTRGWSCSLRTWHV